MSEDHWGPSVAAKYDERSAAMFADDVLGPTVAVLKDLARGGRALEFAIGTGRVGLALHAAGVDVSGIEMSEPMVAELRRKSDAVPVAIGPMESTRVDGEFDLVYLVYNTIMNITTQDGQVACFENAAAHLKSGGVFVVEVIVPELRRLPPGNNARAFVMTDDYVAFEHFTDLENQIAWSKHYWLKDGEVDAHVAPYRYVWPSELDLMARIAGMRLRNRWADFSQAPFEYDSRSHVSVYEKSA